MEQRDAGAEQHRMDVESNFVDEPRLEKGPGQRAATHQADVLAAFALQLPNEFGGIDGNDSDRSARVIRTRSREHKCLLVRIRSLPLTVPKCHLVRDSAHEYG